MRPQYYMFFALLLLMTDYCVSSRSSKGMKAKHNSDPGAYYEYYECSNAQCAYCCNGKDYSSECEAMDDGISDPDFVCETKKCSKRKASKSKPDVSEIVELLNLEPLPEEGGFFRETYRSSDVYNVDNNGTLRTASTAIYYLVTPDSFSSLHRLRWDEVWHFYLGDTLEMLQIYPNGTHELRYIGNDILADEELQVVVPKNVWQGTRLKDSNTLQDRNKYEYALVGTTVAPGFEFQDFEAGDTDALIQQYPDLEELIIRFSH